ncbi:MAG: ankyrin repeat domain-containing protein, partial [Pseudomonadota bacterium]|nr:ankyrin repeat domain-containing protein [Pseudomonadota bacterium]
MDPELRLSDGQTLLIAAAKKGRGEITASLFAFGADPFPKDSRNHSALFHAAEGGFVSICEQIMDAEARRESDNWDRWAECCRRGISKGHLGILDLFIARGLDVDLYLRGGRTLLAEAAGIGSLEAVMRLIGSNADLDVRDFDDKSVLMYAASGKNLELVELLLDAGADVNAKNNAGRTALMYGAYSGSTEIVHRLVSAGAEINAQSDSQRTALDYARMASKSTARRLKKAGALSGHAPSRRTKWLKRLADIAGYDVFDEITHTRSKLKTLVGLFFGLLVALVAIHGLGTELPVPWVLVLGAAVAGVPFILYQFPSVMILISQATRQSSECRRAQDAKRDVPVPLSPSARRQPLCPGSPRSGATASALRA